ncbi:GGDEF domain-containing protein [Mycolicibacterium frederiksbergense]|uniref:GGDEF domain-containing protein n=1 Tax=Mycolicibacterium frederiksbergense TaxID=117567 RepID=UPI00265B81B8|nr:GGDEF domain-containing protein [Mycolicibacterium frederiksbergense]MDO0976391.1 GGDEF domain-containing protein [Mycolicibacterium frederiksbergense]
MPKYSISFAVFARLIRAWWSEPVAYATQVQYFTKRTMSRTIQVAIGVGTGIDGIVSLVLLWPAAGNAASGAAMVTFAALQIAWGLAWCVLPWPTRWSSLAFVVSADIAIAAVVLLDGSWLFALFGWYFFALMSVYVMFFDGAKVAVGHALWVVLTACLFVSGAGSTFGGLNPLVTTLVWVVPMAAAPLGIQCGIWAMRNDAYEAVTDPLTGLLNRRGLHLHIDDLLHGSSSADAEVDVMVVDLDRFKDINDSYGHPIGDEVLIRSARRIKAAVRGSALVARVGGEEFVVIDLAEPGRTERESDRVRDAIAAPADPPITASVGVTSVAVADFGGQGVDSVTVLDTIIERADRAMFDAKRDGGNATIRIRP